MYKILAYSTATSTAPYRIYDPKHQKPVLAGKLTLAENISDSLELTVGPDSWLYTNAEPFKTHVEVYDDKKLIFRGRLFEATREMDDRGIFQRTFDFESIQSYLKDSIQRWEKVQNTSPKDFLQHIINKHNAQVPAYKKFKLRKFEVTNSTDNVYRYIDYVNTWDEIKEDLISSLGGVVQVEYTLEGNYIDYVKYNKGNQNANAIKIGINLKSMSVKEDPTDVITRLVPLGATIETPNRQQSSNPRVTIKDVNGGQDYIDIPDLQKEYGIINGTETWDDVHDASILKTKAQAWIKAQAGAHASYEISALELPNYDKFKVSQTYQIVNPQLMAPQYVRVIQKDIDLLDPYNSTLTIGDRDQTLSEYQYLDGLFKKQHQHDQWKYYSLSDKYGDLGDRYKELSDLYDELKQKIDSLPTTPTDPDPDPEPDPPDSDLRENSFALVDASALRSPQEGDSTDPDYPDFNIDYVENQLTSAGVKNVIIDTGYPLRWSATDEASESYKDDLRNAVKNVTKSSLHLLGIDNRQGTEVSVDETDSAYKVANDMISMLNELNDIAATKNLLIGLQPLHDGQYVDGVSYLPSYMDDGGYKNTYNVVTDTSGKYDITLFPYWMYISEELQNPENKEGSDLWIYHDGRGLEPNTSYALGQITNPELVNLLKK